MPAVASAELCRELLLHLLPAAATGNLGEFGESLFRYGRAAGLLFAKQQGGAYAGAGAAERRRLDPRAGRARRRTKLVGADSVRAVCRPIDRRAIRGPGPRTVARSPVSSSSLQGRPIAEPGSSPSQPPDRP